jgi:hypothetical protein
MVFTARRQVRSFISIFNRMKTPWKFCATFAAGFVIVMGLYAVEFYRNLGVPTNSSRWCSEIYQKKRMAAGKITSPKLLLVGGSGVLFGLSAKEIQDQTGFPTINFGTHAGLKTDYILREARQIARPGDTVLLCLEYELYTYGKSDVSEALVDYVVSRDPDYFYSLSLPEKWNVFMATSDQRLKRGLKNRLQPEPQLGGGIYDSKFINEWGDQTNHPKASQKTEAAILALRQKGILGTDLPEHPAGFELISSFCQWARTNHIRVLATFPNICERPEYYLPPARRTAKTIGKFFAGLDVPVLGDYTESILPPDQFYDTIYHLTDEASIARTQRLLQHLAPYLENGNRQK